MTWFGTPELGDIRISLAEGYLMCGEEKVTLAPAEMQIMVALARAGGATVRRSLLEGAAWGLGTPVTPNALDVAIHRLKRKLTAINSAGGIVEVRIAASRLSVCDEGPGIPADALPKLFQRFWRGPTRHHEGAGLGLSICQEIAAAHNWEITAQSVDRGARFTVLFAQAMADAAAA